MHVFALLFLLALGAPVAWLIAHLDRSGKRLTLRELAGGFASFGYKFSEAGDLTLVTAGRVDELQKEHDEHLLKAREITVAAEKSDAGDFTSAQRAEVKEHVDAARTLSIELAKAKGDQALLDAISKNDAGIAGASGPASTSKGSLGQRFVKDGEITTFLNRLTGNGKGMVSAKTRVQSEAVQFSGVKDILSSGTVGDVGGPAASLVPPDFRGLLDVGTWMRPLTIRDLVSSGTTESDQVSYARMLSVTNNAAPVAEASGTTDGDASGDVTGAKPESGFELETVIEGVKNIAHWVPATKRALSDAAQIRTLIDSFLRYGLEEELEDQMLAGDGTGENFEGILNVSGTQSQDFTTDILVTLRKAKTKAIVGGRARNLAVAVSPNTDEVIDLMQDDQHRYLGNGPFGGQNPTVWGMPRVVCQGLDDDVAIVADWKWAMLWDREQAAVDISDQHADFFTRNLTAFRGELRAAFGVIRPPAFVLAEAHA